MRGFLPILVALLPATLGAQAITATRVGTVGCALCGGPDELGSIQALHLSKYGLLVIDNSPPFFRTFDLSGKSQAAFGRRGSGPGEFRLATGAMRLPDGGLLAVEARAQRLVTLSATHEEVAGTRLSGFPISVGASSRALYTATTDFRTPGFVVDRWTMGAKTPSQVLRTDSTFPLGESGHPAQVYGFAVSPADDIAIGDRASYRIRIYGPDGKVRKTIERNLPAPRKTADELAEDESRFKRNVGRMSRMRAAEGGTGPTPSFRPQPTKPHVIELAYDDLGRLYVLTGRGNANSTVFDLYDAAGKLLGELRIPMHGRTISVHNNMLAMGGEDEEGAPIIALWRIAIN